MSKKIDAHITDKYKIGELIGSGAYGHVWKVEDKITHRHYALKKVFGAFRNNIDAQRTYREVQILQKIHHPNIIRLFKVLGADNKEDLYLVFELMEADLLAVVGYSSSHPEATSSPSTTRSTFSSNWSRGSNIFTNCSSFIATSSPATFCSTLTVTSRYAISGWFAASRLPSKSIPSCQKRSPLAGIERLNFCWDREATATLLTGGALVA
jgi:hypothetical protein